MGDSLSAAMVATPEASAEWYASRSRRRAALAKGSVIVRVLGSRLSFTLIRMLRDLVHFQAVGRGRGRRRDSIPPQDNSSPM